MKVISKLRDTTSSDLAKQPSEETVVNEFLMTIPKKCLLLFTPVSDRIANARHSDKQGKVTVCVCYNPTNKANTETKDTFCSALTTELARISLHNIVILLGDLHATGSDNHD
jgi:hypothetical protein